MKIITLLVFFCETFVLIVSSDGDRSPYYQTCNKKCMNQNCTQVGGFTKQAVNNQDMWNKLLFWSCRDECRYHCMWKTVEGFKDRGYIPKFHGKWPFTRILGIQEPASAFASLLNLATNLYMFLQIRKEFNIKTPLVLFWQVFAIVCMNAWVWSTIFHTRDTPFTEFMDYACALSMVMGLFVAVIVRIFHRKRRLVVSILFIPLVYYVEHVRYLYSGVIDYDYNMKVNIFFGVVGSMIWVGCAARQLARGRRHWRRVVWFSALSGAALLLELFDFPPRYRLWDAHALWHLSTAPLPLLFYQFVIEDLRYLQSSHIEKSNLKMPNFIVNTKLL